MPSRFISQQGKRTRSGLQASLSKLHVLELLSEYDYVRFMIELQPKAYDLVTELILCVPAERFRFSY
jgi:hypothetical protein